MATWIVLAKQQPEVSPGRPEVNPAQSSSLSSGYTPSRIQELIIV